MIAPETCLRLYLAMKMHFTHEKYDAIEYRCAVNNAYDISHVNKRHDSGLIHAMAKRLDSNAMAASFFAANAAYNNMYPFDDAENAFKLYAKWKRIRQSITKVFTDDLCTLTDLGVSYDSLIDSSDGAPKLFLLAKSGRITLETLSILDSYDDFIAGWKSTQSVWKSDYLRLQKLGKFVKFDPAKVEPLLVSFKEELGTENA